MDCMDSSVVQFYRAALWAAAPSKRLCCVTLCRCVSHCWTCGSGASSCCCWLWSESCRLVSEAHCPPAPPHPWVHGFSAPDGQTHHVGRILERAGVRKPRPSGLQGAVRYPGDRIAFPTSIPPCGRSCWLMGFNPIMQAAGRCLTRGAEHWNLTFLCHLHT